MIPTVTVRLFEADSYQTSATARITSVSEQGIRLDQTLFYADSGGQPGDSGILVCSGGELIEIADARYAPGRLSIIHVPKSAPNPSLEGQQIEMKIDWDRRYRLMQMHTCMHILSSLVEAPITGCAIHVDHGRLDFDLEENTLDKVTLSDGINEIIERNVPVEILRWPLSALRTQPGLVRTASVAPPELGETIRIVHIVGIDRQACGGTHVRSTGEISKAIVRKIEKKSRRNRRVSVAFADG